MNQVSEASTHDNCRDKTMTSKPYEACKMFICDITSFTGTTGPVTRALQLQKEYSATIRIDDRRLHR